MPRKSRRAKVIDTHAALLYHRLFWKYARLVYDVNDDDEDILDIALLLRVQQLLRSRYSLPRLQQPRHATKADWYLWRCSDREFLRSFRMDRSTFHRLVGLLEHSDEFVRVTGKKPMARTEVQLMVFMKYIGTHGSDAGVLNLESIFGISAGACHRYIQRITDLLNSLYDKVVYWPNDEERQAIADRFQAQYEFLNCIGVIDGTLLPLTYKPALHSEDYLSRKGCYALNALICCDDTTRVSYVLVGWPGSTHDNRVWRNAAPYRSPTTYFSSGQYLLGDSAFSLSQHLVPPYKKLPGAFLSREQELFNRKLSRPRARIEHCIGLIKSRFQFFKGVRIKIRSIDDLRRIILLFRAAVVIHNLLIDKPLPAEQREAEKTGVSMEL